MHIIKTTLSLMSFLIFALLIGENLLKFFLRRTLAGRITGTFFKGLLKLSKLLLKTGTSMTKGIIKEAKSQYLEYNKNKEDTNKKGTKKAKKVSNGSNVIYLKQYLAKSNIK